MSFISVQEIEAIKAIESHQGKLRSLKFTDTDTDTDARTGVVTTTAIHGNGSRAAKLWKIDINTK